VPTHPQPKGPLAGIRIVEFTGIGPVPFGAMLLADLGADIVRIDRPGGYPPPDPKLEFEKMGGNAIFNRGRRVLRLDVKSAAGRDLVLRLAAQADALLEGYRPGTMERLGLGPEPCLAANPRLVYGRMSGWGQDGPLAQMAGHDLNYIGLSGALSLFYRNGEPPPGIPPLIGDMAGGGSMLALGVLAGILSARTTGKGQVVDAAIIDGSAALYALLLSLNKAGAHDEPAGANLLDGGRHFYRTYRCADGRHVAVGAIEPAFRKVLLERLGLLDDPRFRSDAQEDEDYCRERLAGIFATQPRDHWAALFDGTDACVTPVLSMAEAPAHPHARARAAFVEVDGVVQPAPAPRFLGTPPVATVTAAQGSRNDPDVLLDWGFDRDEIDALRASRAIE
jgi:alpha-methylacyl-CoA racemase